MQCSLGYMKHIFCGTFCINFFAVMEILVAALPLAWEEEKTSHEHPVEKWNAIDTMIRVVETPNWDPL